MTTDIRYDAMKKEFHVVSDYLLYERDFNIGHIISTPCVDILTEGNDTKVLSGIWKAKGTLPEMILFRDVPDEQTMDGTKQKLQVHELLDVALQFQQLVVGGVNDPGVHKMAQQGALFFVGKGCCRRRRVPVEQCKKGLFCGGSHRCGPLKQDQQVAVFLFVKVLAESLFFPVRRVGHIDIVGTAVDMVAAVVFGCSLV